MRDLALEVYFSRWRSAARHDLTSSDSETLGLAELLEMADAEDLRRWETLQLGYTDPRGSLWLRETVADGYEAATAASVLCFAGAQEGIYAAMHALLGADDHAIVITPNYQSTETVPLGLCAVTGVALDPARGWSLEIDAVAAAIRPNTRLVSINFPNNPTGKLLERDRFDALVALCRRRGIWLFSDEIYRLIERDPAMRLPAAVDAYERGISLGCVSKSYGSAGPARRLDRLPRPRSAAPDGAGQALPVELRRRALASSWRGSRSRRATASWPGTAASPSGTWRGSNGSSPTHDDLFDWHVPDGGVVGYPRYKGADGVEAFCARLVEEHGVLLLPASIYRSEVAPTPEDHFRIGFGRRDFPAGLDALTGGTAPGMLPITRRAG